MDDAAGLDTTITRDPVCGMTVDPEAGKPTREHRGRKYHFCAERCRERFAADPDAFAEATDPVCGMTVDRATAAATARHGAERVWFCSEHCRDRFEADPEAFLGAAPEPEPAPAGTRY